MIATVDPRFRVPYYTYVLQGLVDSGVPVRFRRLSAPIEHINDGMAIEVDDQRVFVNTGDKAIVNERMRRWADTYGQVNLPLASDEEIVALGPTFGIRFWNRAHLPYAAARLILAGASPRHTVPSLRFQAITRLPISEYSVAPPATTRVVFSANRRWPSKHQAANAPRERFLKAVEAAGVPLDGGLVKQRLPLADYLKGVSQSVVVFNAPAVHGCLGWKLGEFLALGKAIISTSLDRRLPAPLVHGVHVHFVEDDEPAIRGALERLIDDADYRGRLERGARQWFDDHLRPRVVVRSLLDRGSSPAGSLP